MLESYVKTVQTQWLKANTNKGSSLIPATLGIKGHSFWQFLDA